MMNAKGPILAADLAGMLIFGGFMDAAAQDDPAGYDNYRTMEKVGYLADLLNARVAAETASAASPQAAAESKSTRRNEQGDVPASDTSPKRVDETLNVVHEVGEPTALEADARRYRWLRSIDSYAEWNRAGHYAADALDKLVDAALALQQEKK